MSRAIRRRWVVGAVLLLQSCGDDGHVVGDMASGGSGGLDSSASSNSGPGATNTSSSNASSTNGNSTNGSGGSSPTTQSSTVSTTSAAGGSSGNTSAGGASGGNSSGGGASGGSASGGVSAGGTSGTGGSSTSGSGGTGMVCPDGQRWCPGCRVDEGSCTTDPVCPALPCQACSAAGDAADCDSLTNCHSVYQDPHNCFCAEPGCCAQFAYCEVGATAECEGTNVACDSLTPYCEEPAFVVSYTADCYEGCVKPEVCATAPTSGGTGGSGGTSGEVCPCDPDVCTTGQQMCLMGDTCVVADGIQGNGICRTSDGTCTYCVCASPDTPIATASGDRPIRDLRVGDLVYSVDHDATVLVPIRRVNRTAVIRHRVLRVEFDDGSKFEMSGGHPTAMGQALSELRVGQEVGGHRVTRIKEIAYQHPFTYDILPDSDTGSYFADGVLMGSTLTPGFVPEPMSR